MKTENQNIAHLLQTNFGVGTKTSIKIHKKLGINTRQSPKKIKIFLSEKIKNIYETIIIGQSLKNQISANITFKQAIKIYQKFRYKDNIKK